MVNLKTVVFNDAKLKRVLNKTLSRLKNTAGIMSRIGVVGERGIEGNFIKERDSKNRSWKPLSEATIALRRKNKNRNIRILRDTGRLSHINFNARNGRVLIGTIANYGKKHQFGGSTYFLGKMRRIPKREWLYLDDKTRRKIKLTMEDYLKDSFR